MPHKAKGNGKVQATEPCSSPVASPCPARLTYALKAWTAERRSDGWYVSLTTPGFGGEKPGWRGPFETIETACLAIARGQAVEIADRHTRHIEQYKIDVQHPLYGLKPQTRLQSRGNGSVT